MLCYITHDMLLYDTCNAMLYNTCYVLLYNSIYNRRRHHITVVRRLLSYNCYQMSDVICYVIQLLSDD